MKERKLNCRFHDPNPAAVTAGYIVKLFLETGAGKVERAMREASALPGPEDGRSAPGKSRGQEGLL